MPNVVKVCFKKNGKMYFFSTNNINNIKLNDEVIVETEKGQQYGLVCSGVKDINEKDIGMNLKNVLRIATEKDKKAYKQNIIDADKALVEARKIVTKMKIPMRIIDATFTFDRNQLIFNFLAEDRVDFRELAKKLAQVYKTRIELRQIGVRDKAREVGGLGPCGRFLCCSTFLTDFNSVSINMAKNQMLALNPTKINGVCGRLLCCLNYEDEVYSDRRHVMPNVGETFKNADVDGKIVTVNLLKGSILVETKNKTIVEIEDEKWKS